MFPIRDARGRVQGFGARALLPDQKPKYVNSPEGELYSKRRTLYGIERARPQIVKSGRAVVVEGYTDVLACHQAGIRDAVAIMGTAITPEQVKLLSAYAEEAVLALDADRAGREAMLRAQAVGGKRVAAAGGADARGQGPGRPARRRRRGERDRVPRRDRGGRGPAGLPRPHAARRRRPDLAVGPRPGARRGRRR